MPRPPGASGEFSFRTGLGARPLECHNQRDEGAQMTDVQSPMVVHAARLPKELLERAGLEHEPVVMLESTDAGALVRKLTPTEKNEYQERTGENVFFATEQEFDEAILALPYDRETEAE